MDIQKASLKQTLLFVVGVIALIWFVLVPIARGMVESDEPATAVELKDAIGNSPCMKRVLQEKIEQGRIIKRDDLAVLQKGCAINDEQRSALAN
ncbi:hypothetical protein ABOC32_28880 (plasmid) [Pseudomonas sp. WOUb67]|uniref:hypothetical protein n=1 Tax=Pseudomonas sp. WOUb67 TaxID=3161136 RepID=UPI003CF92C67